MRKRTFALSISLRTKKAVAERDSVDGWPCCVYCGRPAPTENPLAFSCAHYISRAQGGLGIVWNIITLCTDCHRLYDQTERRNELRQYLRAYLMRAHKGWNEESLTYQKGG